VKHQPIGVSRPSESHAFIARCSCGWTQGFFDGNQAKSALAAHVSILTRKGV
jgi:hypothetical protein